MTAAAATERERWVASAAQARFGACDGCGRGRDDDGKRLYVTRAKSARRFLCFDCSTKPPSRRRQSMTTSAPEKPAPAKKAPPSGTLMMLKLSQLKPAGDNPRKEVGDVTELAESMGELGVLEPFVAVQQNGHYLIVAGARRYAAATLAGLAEVPVLVRELTDEQRVKAMLIENLQREDLTPLEEAAAYQRLVAEFKVSQRALATTIGRSQGHISKRLALLALPETVRAQADSGGITLAEAAELGKLGADEAAIARVLARPSYQSIEGQVEVELDRIEKEAAIEAAAAAAEKDGARVVRLVVDGYYTKLPKGVYRIQKGASYGNDVLGLDPVKHATEECHAIAIDPRTNEPYPVCTNRKNHPKVKTPDERNRAAYATTNQSYAEQSRKREQLQKVLEPLEEARHAFVLDLLGRKSAIAKDAALELVLRAAIRNALEATTREGDAAFEQLFDVQTDDLDAALEKWAAAGTAELIRVALAATLIEQDQSSCSTWTGAVRGTWGDDDARHLALLEQYGYEISDAERQLLPAAAA